MEQRASLVRKKETKTKYIYIYKGKKKKTTAKCMLSQEDGWIYYNTPCLG
jgi:ribosomal protein S9